MVALVLRADGFVVVFGAWVMGLAAGIYGMFYDRSAGYWLQNGSVKVQQCVAAVSTTLHQRLLSMPCNVQYHHVHAG